MAGQKEEECAEGNLKEEDGKVYICKKGKWETYKKDKTIEGGIGRIFGLSPKDRKTYLTR